MFYLGDGRVRNRRMNFCKSYFSIRIEWIEFRMDFEVLGDPEVHIHVYVYVQ